MVVLINWLLMKALSMHSRMPCIGLEIFVTRDKFPDIRVCPSIMIFLSF